MAWSIEISNFSGYAPQWWTGGYLSYGNKNQSSSMLYADVSNPNFLTQGPGLANLTNGTQAAAVTTLIKGILDQAVTSDATYGVGGTELYKISASAVTSDGTWPHTIDKAAVTDEEGEDVALYQGNLYYTYNHSGSAGDIGKYDLSSTFDDDWGSTTPTGFAALQGAVPHPMTVGENDVLYIANGRYVASYDGTTFIPQALDFPSGTIIQDIKWASNRLFISANKSSLTGNNKNQASVYVWDGTTDSWEMEIKLMGTTGGLHVRNGVVFVFYHDITSTGGYKIAYISGSSLVDLANFTGGVPAFYQITDYKDFILWAGGANLFAFGSGDKDAPVKLFLFADGGYSTVGGLSAPFGTTMVASNETTSYKLAKFSGYDLNTTWNSLMFDITGNGRVSKINAVRLNFGALASGARMDWSLVNSQGTTVYSDHISYAKLGGATTAYFPLNGKVTPDFRVELSFANGSATNNVQLRNFKVYGDTD